MLVVRQSTARTFMVGPVLDSSGAAVTTAVIGDFKLSVNGGAPAAFNGSATLTHRHTGNYSLAATATDLGTVGSAEVTLDKTTDACAPKELTVLEEAVYDALFAASAPGYLQPTTAGRTLDVSVGGAAGVDWGNVENPTTALNLSGTNIDVDQVVASVSGAVGSVTGAVGSVTGSVGSVAAGGIASTSFVAGAIDAAAIGADAITDAKVAADVTIASVTGAVGSVTGAVGSVTGNVGGNVTGNVGGFTAGAKAEIESEVNDALVVHRLDELLNADSDIDGAAPPTVGSVFHELMTKTAGSFTYDQTTDSQEALRDRGDAAWTTGTGTSTLTQADVRTAVGLASANLDTQLDALPTAAENAVAVVAQGSLGSDVDDIRTRVLLALPEAVPNDPEGGLAVLSQVNYGGGDIVTILSGVDGAVWEKHEVLSAHNEGSTGKELYDQIAALATAAALTAVKAVTDKLDTMLQLEGAGPNSQYTVPALENAPAGGGGGGTDWTTTEKNQIRHALAIDGTRAAPVNTDVPGIWTKLKSAFAALASTTWGGWVYAQLAKIGTADGVTIAPVTANGTEDDPGTLYAGADYLAANGQPLDFTVTGRADLTGLPMYLAFGDPPEGHPTIFQVSGGVVLSGAAGNQIVRFEATHDDTDALTNHHDELIVAVLQVNFGASADQYTPVAEAWYRVRAKYVTP